MVLTYLLIPLCLSLYLSSPPPLLHLGPRRHRQELDAEVHVHEMGLQRAVERQLRRAALRRVQDAQQAGTHDRCKVHVQHPGAGGGKGKEGTPVGIRTRLFVERS